LLITERKISLNMVEIRIVLKIFYTDRQVCYVPI